MTNSKYRRTAFWLLAGMILTAAMFPLDAAVDDALVVASSSPWHRVAWWCSKLGEGWMVGAVAIFFTLIFLWQKKSAVAAKIFFVAFVSEITGLVALILRLLFCRTRPTAPLPQGFYGWWHDGHRLIGQYQFSSFPSGHAATAAGLFTAAWLVNRRWGTVASIYALAVIWSRIALRCHHLSDVVASLVLSVAVANLLHRHFAPRNARFFTRWPAR